MKALTFVRLLGATCAIAFAACGGSASPTDDGLLFRGEGKLLEGFAFDTGPQPPSGPASVSLQLSGNGAVKVEARGRIADGKLEGAPGSGSINLEAHVKVDGTLKIDSPIKKSTGDIPGLKDIDIAIKGSAPFEPFLLGRESADVVAAIPETKLPDVPLGSVPGKLRLAIGKGSELNSKYVGSCLTVAAGVAQYSGIATTSGKLVLMGTIALELPAPLNKEIALPPITVTIPSATSAVTFATVATIGAADSTSGACGAPSKDSGTDSAKSEDTGVVADSAPAETSTPTCSGEAYEPDSLREDARLLPVIRDCDGDEAIVSGMLSSDKDVDTLRFIGEDTLGCVVNAYAKIVGRARVCLAPVCTVGATKFQGCAKGTREGDECCGTEVEADFDCTETTKDNARVYLTVKPYAGIDACSPYSIRYHY